MLQVKFGTEQKARHNQYREMCKSRKTSCQATWHYPPHPHAPKEPQREKGECYTVHPSIIKKLIN